MKKVVAFLVSAALLAGCSADGDQSSSVPPSSSAPVFSSAPESSSQISASEPESQPQTLPAIAGSDVDRVIELLSEDPILVPPGEYAPSSLETADYRVSSSREDDVLGVEFDYYLMTDADHQLISGEFAVMSDLVLSESDFMTVVTLYLMTAAEMPCDAVNDLNGIASNWVALTLENPETIGDGANIIWGDASYTLSLFHAHSGVLTGASLIIQYVDPDSPPSSESQWEFPSK